MFNFSFQPIEIREALPEKEKKITRLSISYNTSEINHVSFHHVFSDDEFEGFIILDTIYNHNFSIVHGTFCFIFPGQFD